MARSLQARCTLVPDDFEPMTSPLKTFIRATEIWLPSSDGLLLEFGGGLFAGAAHFAAISRAMCFGRAEGLPGSAWEEGRPILLKQFEGSNFRRTAAAKAAGLGCAVALPMFLGDRLTSVLVFFCSDNAAQGGALEQRKAQPFLEVLDLHADHSGIRQKRHLDINPATQRTGDPHRRGSDAIDERNSVQPLDLGLIGKVPRMRTHASRDVTAFSQSGYGELSSGV